MLHGVSGASYGACFIPVWARYWNLVKILWIWWWFWWPNQVTNLHTYVMTDQLLWACGMCKIVTLSVEYLNINCLWIGFQEENSLEIQIYSNPSYNRQIIATTFCSPWWPSMCKNCNDLTAMVHITLKYHAHKIWFCRWKSWVKWNLAPQQTCQPQTRQKHCLSAGNFSSSANSFSSSIDHWSLFCLIVMISWAVLQETWISFTQTTVLWIWSGSLLFSCHG